jgi:hypothetical protein
VLCGQTEIEKGCLTAALRFESLRLYDSLLAIVDVHRYFEAEAHFGEFGLGPHSRISSGGLVYYCAQNTGAIVVKQGRTGQRKTLKCAS